MIIDKTSWHYRLNLQLNSDYRISCNKDLCSYFWLTAKTLIVVSLMLGLVALVITLLILITNIAILDPLAVLGATLIVAIMVVFLMIVMAGIRYIKKAPSPNSNIFSARYRSWKEGYCEKVEYK